MAKLLHRLPAHCMHLPGNSPKITCHLSDSMDMEIAGTAGEGTAGQELTLEIGLLAKGIVLDATNIQRQTAQDLVESRAVLNAKKKKVGPEPGNFKRARGQYMSSPRCSQLFNHESLAPNWSQHTTI